jgi:hypothetical protein
VKLFVWGTLGGDVLGRFGTSEKWSELLANSNEIEQGSCNFSFPILIAVNLAV